jgi:hypothetical protein
MEDTKVKKTGRAGGQLVKNKKMIEGSDGIREATMPGRSEAELRYSAIFEQSPDGILIIDAEGKILDFNKAAHTDLGYTRKEFAKFSLSDIDPVESPEEIRAHIQKTIKEKKAEFEVTHRTKSGQLRNVLVITQTIVLSGSTVLHAIWRDITDQKAIDKKVRYLASILEHVPDALCSIDTEGRIVSWNEGAERMLGYKADEIIGRPIQSIIPEEKVREEVEHCIDELSKGEVFTGHESVRIAKDGRRVPVEISGLALRDGQNITGYASIMRDITKRTRMANALAESEAKYRDLFENSSDAVFVLDSGLRYADVNRKGVELLGYKREELLGRQPFDFIPEEQGLHSAAEFEKLRNTGSYEAFEGRMLTKDGRWIDIEVSSTAIFRDGVFAGSRDIVRDITERKKAEDALKQNEHRLKEAQKTAHIGDWEWDIPTNKVYWSDELFRIYGYAPYEIQPDYGLVVEAMHPDSKVEFLAAIDAALKGQRPFEMDYTFFRRDGVTAVLHTIGKVFRDANGAPVRMTGTVQDITERKKAEEVLAANQKFLDTIFESAPT